LRVRVGLAGCGRWGRHILRDLKTLGCWVAVAATHPESLSNAHAGGADAVVASVDDLPQVDAAVVAVPTHLHGEVVLRLAGRGCPIFCEKPLTSDVASARRIVETAGERVFVMDKWRYHPGVLALRDIAGTQELGPVLGIASVRVQWGSPHDDVDLAWILLPHDLSIALEILGYLPAPLHAVAESDAEGLVALSAWLAGAAWLHSEVGIRSPQHRRNIELRCRDGVAVLGDAYARHIAVLRADRSARGRAPPAWEERPFVERMPLLAELEAFVAYVGGASRAPKSTASEGLRVVETIAELHRLAGVAG
jgi:predicted dehydrogenase